MLKNIDFLLKVNTRVAEAVGFIYLSYLRRIFSDLLRMYGLYSQCISNQVRSANRVNETVFKAMKMVRRDVLKLIQTYINTANDYAIFNQEMLPTLQGLVEDYQQNDPLARDPEVLKLFATLLKKQGNVISGFLQQILYNLCETTLVIIKDDFLSMPEFREGLFTLVQAIVKYGTQGLFQLPPE